jgi:hypothetical protein
MPGLATALCEHSQQVALDLGYKAMQFNFVASSNESAVKLWQKLGFEIVGRIPAAFEHPEKSFVDALVMHKWLQPESKPSLAPKAWVDPCGELWQISERRSSFSSSSDKCAAGKIK